VKNANNLSILDGGIISDSRYSNMLEMFFDFLDEEKIRELVFIHSGITEIITYGELQKQAIKVATNLQQNHVAAGENIVFISENKKEFLVLFWGIILAGCVAVPVSAIQKGMSYSDDNIIVSNLKYSYSVTKSKILLAGNNDFNKIRKAKIFNSEELFSYSDLLKDTDVEYDKPIINKEDLALIMYTSGTTAKPKGVVISHSNVIDSCIALKKVYNCNSKSCFVNWMELTHIAGLTTMHIAMLCNHTNQVHIDAIDVTRDVSFWIETLYKYKATHTFSPNFGYALIVENEEKIKSLNTNLSSLEMCLTGGEGVSLEISKKLIEILRLQKADKANVVPVYGMTESTIPVVFNCKLDYMQDEVFASVGTPIAGTKVRITDENGNILDDGKQGFIELKGSSVMREYYQDIENTNIVFTNDGWYQSGDIGYIKGGELIICGREKDMAIINGVNYACLEIENLLKRVKGITGYLTCIPYREPSMQTDQIVIFYSTNTPNDIDNHQRISDSMAELMLNYYGVSFSYAIPLKISDFPKLSFGKMNKRKLKELFLSGAIKPLEAIEDNFIEDYNESLMLGVWKSILHTSNLSINDKFYSIGGNSLNSVALVEAINGKFGCKIGLSDLFANPSVREILQYIQ